MLIKLHTGNATFRGYGGIKLLAFYRKNVKAAEAPIFQAIKDPKSECKQQGSPFVLDASESNKNLGTWYNNTYIVPPESVIRFVISKRTTNSGFSSEKAFLLYMSEDAPYNEITIPLLPSPDAALTNAYVEGRFYVLDFDQVLALDIRLENKHQYDELVDTDDTETFYKISEKHAARKKFVLPSFDRISTASGNEVRVTRAPVRKLRFKP